jgi:hypothetical protein
MGSDGKALRCTECTVLDFEVNLAIIDIIRQKVADGEYEFTLPHFFEEMADDDLVFPDIEMAIAHGHIRRRFTEDPRGTRYEVVGSATDDRDIAVICRIKTTGKLLFITTYALEESL